MIMTLAAFGCNFAMLLLHFITELFKLTVDLLGKKFMIHQS